MIYFGGTKVGVNALKGVDVQVGEQDVVFRDCDGTVLHVYTAAQVAGMQSMPDLPSRTGLVCQEWNWSLSNMKSYVTKYGKCDIGATYTTNDGKTRLKLVVRDSKYTQVKIVFQQTVSNGVKVDWGDGSAEQTYEGTTKQTIQHQYQPSSYPAAYTVSFEVVSGTMSFPDYIMGITDDTTAIQRSANLSMIEELNAGDGLTSIGNNAFCNCYSLKLVTLPKTTTSIGQNAFSSCSSLESVVLPNGLTVISGRLFNGCRLKSVSIPPSVTNMYAMGSFYGNHTLESVCIPDGVTELGGGVFRECCSLKSVVLPDSLTIIGGQLFYMCYALQEVQIPATVTNIGELAFAVCYSLRDVQLPSGLTSIGRQLFSACYSMHSMVIPSQVASVGDIAFSNCSGLTDVTLPDGLGTIGQEMFGNCRSLAYLALPSSTALIKTKAFNKCFGLKTFDFRKCAAVPALDNVDAFANTPDDKEIVVPDSLYAAWTAATNWTDLGASIVKASESSLGPL